jgi:ATP-binding cassette subfamily C protein CydC
MASFEAVAPLPATALRLRATMASGRRLLEIAQEQPSVADPAVPDLAPTVPPAALDGVSFAYTSGEGWDLESVDVRLTSGRRVALVGPSGAGKSTVAALLVRFLDPDGGRVTLGDVDERRLRQRDVRAAVTLDGQDAYLFSTSIRENVRLAKPGAGDEEVEEALRRAQVLAWVKGLPEGLDTFVGEEGDQVSGGERRRLVLARAFLANAPVLVLDEPTAHLDGDTATLLMADVLAASRDRSVLLITHRPEGLDQVDEIIRLRRGRLAGD